MAAPIVPATFVIPRDALTKLPPPQPPAEQVQKFDAAFSAPHVLAQEAQPVQTPQTPQPTNPATLGERILSSIDRMRNAHRTAISQMEATLAKEPAQHPKITDMMQIFVQVTQLTLHEEMLGRMVSKTTQNLDSLLKGQ